MSKTQPTPESLDAELLKLGNDRDALRDRMKELTAQRDRLDAERSAQDELAGMSPQRRDALVRVAAVAASGKAQNPA